MSRRRFVPSLNALESRTALSAWFPSDPVAAPPDEWAGGSGGGSDFTPTPPAYDPMAPSLIGYPDTGDPAPPPAMITDPFPPVFIEGPAEIA